MMPEPDPCRPLIGRYVRGLTPPELGECPAERSLVVRVSGQARSAARAWAVGEPPVPVARFLAWQRRECAGWLRAAHPERHSFVQLGAFCC